MACRRRFAQIGLCAALILFCVCLVVVLSGSLGRGRSASIVAALPGTPAEGFRLPDLDSKLISLDEMRGRVVVLCIANPDHRAQLFPRLRGLMDQFESEPRVQTLTIFRTENVPGSPQVNQIRIDLAAAGLRCPALLDVSSDVSRNYRADHGTSLFVIDSSGVIRNRFDHAEARPAAFADAQRGVQRLLTAQASAGRGLLAMSRTPAR